MSTLSLASDQITLKKRRREALSPPFEILTQKIYKAKTRLVISEGLNHLQDVEISLLDRASLVLDDPCYCRRLK